MSIALGSYAKSVLRTSLRRLFASLCRDKRARQTGSVPDAQALTTTSGNRSKCKRLTLFFCASPPAGRVPMESVSRPEPATASQLREGLSAAHVGPNPHLRTKVMNKASPRLEAGERCSISARYAMCNQCRFCACALSSQTPSAIAYFNAFQAEQGSAPSPPRHFPERASCLGNYSTDETTQNASTSGNSRSISTDCTQAGKSNEKLVGP